MISKLYSVSFWGLQVKLVEVEVDITPGLFSFNIVGLPDKAVEESKDRVSSAIKNSGAKAPNQQNKKTIVNLAPADLKKEGSLYDLPIALGFLLASGQVRNFDSSKTLFLGELALDGKIRPVPGILLASIFAKENGFKNIVVPKLNEEEALLAQGPKVIAVESLNQLIDIIEQKISVSQKTLDTNKLFKEHQEETEYAFIAGQEKAKRAMMISAAGGHNLIMVGPPGTGKTLLAKNLSALLPKLNFDEALEVTKIWSVAGLLKEDESLIVKRPFRAPHHSTSSIALIGGGTFPKPGEISLAHRGVLFLDEIAEFQRSALENLRQPLEEGYVTISRARATIKFPAKFILISAMNPCPCGYLNDPKKVCECTQSQIVKYKKKISGPLMDRIDLQVEVGRISFEDFKPKEPASNISEIKQKIEMAREYQLNRFMERNKHNKNKIFTNSEMGLRDIKNFCEVSGESEQLLKSAMDEFGLSARAYHRILKVARTIADLEESKNIETQHIAEALQYRLDQS